MTYKDIEAVAKQVAISYPTGFGINIGKYLNTPLIYTDHLNELRSTIFKFKPDYKNSAMVSLQDDSYLSQAIFHLDHS